MIHGHDHTPFLEHQGFSIRPGTETTIGIREVGGLPRAGAEEGPQPSHSSALGDEGQPQLR